jgi:hypothetical protein
MSVSSFNFIVDPSSVDLSYKDGKFRGYIEGSDSGEALMGVGVKEFPQELYIPRSDWDDWIRENDKHECWPENYSSRFTNQSPTSECVYHCRTQCFETTYNQMVGMEYCVWTSPLHGYRHDKGPNGERGGAMVNESLKHAMSVGLLPEFDGAPWMGGNNGQLARFKHTMHQTGGTGRKPPGISLFLRRSGFRTLTRTCLRFSAVAPSAMAAAVIAFPTFASSKTQAVDTCRATKTVTTYSATTLSE